MFTADNLQALKGNAGELKKKDIIFLQEYCKPEGVISMRYRQFCFGFSSINTENYFDISLLSNRKITFSCILRQTSI